MKYALAVLLLSLPSFAQTCQSTFTSGSGHSLVKFCVTANGNIAEFAAAEAPGYPVAVISGEEGYMVGVDGQCYFDSGVADSGNWAPSVIIQPHGPNTFPLSIQRSSSDGLFTLTQTFKWLSGHSGVTVTMALESAYVGSVARYARLVGDTYPPMASKTYNSGFLWTQAPQGVGIGGNGLVAFQTPRDLANVYIVLPQSDLCSPFTMPDVPYQGSAATLMYWQLNKMRHEPPVSFNYSVMR